MTRRQKKKKQQQEMEEAAKAEKMLKQVGDEMNEKFKIQQQQIQKTLNSKVGEEKGKLILENANK